MKKFQKLKLAYEDFKKGGNILEFLKKYDKSLDNNTENIQISYDLQSGSYTKSYAKEENFIFKEKYTRALAKVISKLGDIETIMEAGVGEATTLIPLMSQIQGEDIKFFGFDISWSRLKFAKLLTNEVSKKQATYFCGDLFNIPLNDSSIDVVYTSHSIEPNGGREKEALIELMRITNKYLILLEPSYEHACEEGKSRMIKHGYIKDLYAHANELKFNIIEHRAFEYSANHLNPTGLIILKKENSSKLANHKTFNCPLSGTNLVEIENLFFSRESFMAYPVIGGIPCLLKENAILASHLETDFVKFKIENGISFNELIGKNQGE